VYSWQKYDVFVFSPGPTVLRDIYYAPVASVTRYSLVMLLNTNQLTIGKRRLWHWVKLLCMMLVIVICVIV